MRNKDDSVLKVSEPLIPRWRDGDWFTRAFGLVLAYVAVLGAYTITLRAIEATRQVLLNLP